MPSETMNQDVYWTLRKRVVVAQYQVYQASKYRFEPEVRMNLIVYEALYQAVYQAEDLAVDDDPPHPGLAPFLKKMER